MVKYGLVAIFLLLLLSCGSSNSNEQVEYRHQDSLFLIPAPITLQKGEGCFELNDQSAIFIAIEHASDLASESNYLKSLIDGASYFSIEAGSKTGNIELLLTDKTPPDEAHIESYQLDITKEKIKISAMTPTGIMRGIQTLRQLFIPDFHGKEKRDQWYLPCLFIEDKPRFQHRGLLIDVCRHFFEMEVIKKYIDLLAYYKMNTLHFHLTEDQGWRLQVDKYPLLNEISSWRTDSSRNKYGGFYSKEQLKDLVVYAQERHIEIIPEIELPGHSQAALAAYPQFSCTGEQVDVATDWGVFKEIYCAGNDSTFVFLEDVLTEVMDIFPSRYIHIGGDEAPKTRWEQCPKCQKRMKEERLRDEHELQTYFIQRIDSFLTTHGRILIGWDEILEGGLSENATVQSWRGMDGGKQAAKQGHNVIMSPTSHCYLDYDLAAIDLEKVYRFDPVPEGLDSSNQKYILGAEVNMWTEHVPDEANLDSKILPRMIAMSEVLWTYPEERNYSEFYDRIQYHYPVLDLFGFQYGFETVAGKIVTENEKELFKVLLTKKLSNLSYQYRWNFPDGSGTPWNDFDKAIHPVPSGTIEVKASKHGKAYGPVITQKIENHKAIYTRVDYNLPLNEYYPAGGKTGLVDGMLGSLDFRDGNWQGFAGKDLSLITELNEQDTISELSTHFYQYANAWIFTPSRVKFFHSKDGTNWICCYDHKTITPNLSNEKQIIEERVLLDQKTEAKYIKLVVTNLGRIPAPHEAEGESAWIFIDEIIVR